MESNSDANSSDSKCCVKVADFSPPPSLEERWKGGSVEKLCGETWNLLYPTAEGWLT